MRIAVVLVAMVVPACKAPPAVMPAPVHTEPSSYVEPVYEPFCRVAGEVVEMTTSTPIPGAVVVLRGPGTEEQFETTGEHGEFSLQASPRPLELVVYYKNARWNDAITAATCGKPVRVEWLPDIPVNGVF